MPVFRLMPVRFDSPIELAAHPFASFVNTYSVLLCHYGINYSKPVTWVAQLPFAASLRCEGVRSDTTTLLYQHFSRFHSDNKINVDSCTKCYLSSPTHILETSHPF